MNLRPDCWERTHAIVAQLKPPVLLQAIPREPSAMNSLKVEFTPPGNRTGRCPKPVTLRYQALTTW